MCPPGPLRSPVTSVTIDFSDSWILSSGTPARESPAGVLVSSVSTSTMSPDAMRSTGLRLGPVIAVGDGRRRGRQAHGLGFACTADGETTQEGGRCSQLMGFPHDGYGSTTRRPLGPTLQACTYLVPGRNQAATNLRRGILEPAYREHPRRWPPSFASRLHPGRWHLPIIVSHLAAAKDHCAFATAGPRARHGPPRWPPRLPDTSYDQLRSRGIGARGELG